MLAGIHACDTDVTGPESRKNRLEMSVAFEGLALVTYSAG